MLAGYSIARLTQAEGTAMEMRMFGRTGMRFSVLGFGCGAVGGLIVRGNPADQEAIQPTRSAPSRGQSPPA
jgi:aryl-alcohol dehydrogenase-like predicted oxidoreductase